MARPLAVCLRGHDIEVVGRNPSGQCTECKRLDYLKRKAEGRTLRQGIRHGEGWYARRHQCDCDPCLDALERARLRMTHWPVAPLMPFLPAYERGECSWGTYAGIQGYFTASDARQLQRILAQGWISPYQADRYAVLLGRHPSEIWTQWYDGEEAMA